jgi:hypothetical protein
MTKEHILSEIRRTAAENGGAPLGVDRFLGETGIKESDWRGKFWVRWNGGCKRSGVPAERTLWAVENTSLPSSFPRRRR